MKVGIRRVYDPPQEDEGLRVLVDRLWPRGLRKTELAYDLWEKDLAPSADLRKWFGHAAQRYDDFAHRYRRELDAPATRERLLRVMETAGKRRITLLYGARDERHNHARVLADVIGRLY